MTPRITRPRAAATLVELLVVMSIIAALAAIALMMLPSVANSDATLKGTAEVQSALKISQAMAGSAQLPRGVRLLVQPNSTVCTEMQYLEAPPVMVGDQKTLVATASNPTGTGGPRIVFSYELAGPQMAMTDPPQGTVTNRHCYISGSLTADQQSQIAPGATLVLPTLGAWSRITSSVFGPNNEITIDVYPDALLGAGGDTVVSPTSRLYTYQTYHFGVYGPPVPLIGEPTVQLPQKIAIDMAVSLPFLTKPGQSYDIMFSPSGQMLTSYSTTVSGGVNGNNAIFLWVRDISKVPSMQPTSFSPWTFDPTQQQFLKGGEQQIVGVRNGFVGSAPVLWPDATGNYANGTDPFTMARNRLN